MTISTKSESYRAGAAAYHGGQLYSDEPSMLNLTVNLEEWKAGLIDELIKDVRSKRAK